MNTSLKILLVVCAILFSSDLVFANELKLSIRSSVIEVDSKLVRITDIADIEGENAGLEREIGQLDLDEIQTDQAVEVSKKQIEMRIRLAKLTFDSISISGPEKVVVKRIPPVDLQAAAKALIVEALVSQFGINREDVRLTINPASLAQTVLRQQDINNAIVELPPELPLGKSTIRFVFDGNTGEEIPVLLDCRIGIVAEMLIASRNIDRGTQISQSDYKVVRRPVSDRSLVPASKKDLLGKETTKVIPMHGVIRLASLRSAPKKNLVERNDVVDVVISRGALKLRYRNARVMTSGGKGDRVEFLNPESQKRQVASVVSESLLEIR